MFRTAFLGSGLFMTFLYIPDRPCVWVQASVHGWFVFHVKLLVYATPQNVYLDVRQDEW